MIFKILADTVYPFQKAINIPGFDIGTLDNDMKISWPGSKYTGKFHCTTNAGIIYVDNIELSYSLKYRCYFISFSRN